MKECERDGVDEVDNVLRRDLSEKRVRRLGVVDASHSAEGFPIEIWKTYGGDLEVVALNEGGHASTGIRLEGLLQFLASEETGEMAEELGWTIKRTRKNKTTTL